MVNEKQLLMGLLESLLVDEQNNGPILSYDDSVEFFLRPSANQIIFDAYEEPGAIAASFKVTVTKI